VPTTVNYVAESDIENHHGKEFFNQWKAFAKDTKTFQVNGKDVYYYADYKHLAIRTHMFINAV
jgi:hypothetical protein